jgi:hypothetical protein
MFDLTDFQSYQDYFSAIATNHKQINGFLFGDDDIANNAAKSWPSKTKKLWLEPWPPVETIDNQSDNKLLRKKGALWVGGSPPSQTFQAREDHYKACEIIVKDIISKLEKDNTEFNLLIEGASYKFGKATYEVSATKLLGCRLDFSFLDPSGFPYIEENWNNP